MSKDEIEYKKNIKLKNLAKQRKKTIIKNEDKILQEKMIEGEIAKKINS